MEHGFPDILNDHISILGLPRPILEKLHAAYDWENAPAIIKLVMEGMDNEVLMFHYHLSKRQIDKVDEALKPHGLSIQRLSSEEWKERKKRRHKEGCIRAAETRAWKKKMLKIEVEEERRRQEQQALKKQVDESSPMTRERLDKDFQKRAAAHG